jgi:hypothetical protein
MPDPMRPAAMLKHVSQGLELGRGQGHRSLVPVNTGFVLKIKGLTACPEQSRVQGEPAELGLTNVCKPKLL